MYSWNSVHNKEADSPAVSQSLADVNWWREKLLEVYTLGEFPGLCPFDKGCNRRVGLPAFQDRSAFSNGWWQKCLVPKCTNLNHSEFLPDTNLYSLHGWKRIYTYILWWISLFGLWPHHRGFSNLFWVLIDYSIWKNVQQIAPLIKVNQADVIDAKYMSLQ